MLDSYDNSFEIEVNAPYSLNYLLFMQNIFLNQHDSQLKRPLFPYLDSSKWGLLEKEKFPLVFRDVWEEATSKNAANRRFDHNGLFENQKELFQKLFLPNEAGNYGFNESVKAFLAWWDTIAGKIAVEKIFDEDRMNKIYSEMASKVKPTENHNRLMIDLVYDRPVLHNERPQSWYMVISIEDVFISNRRQDLIKKLQQCCER